MSETNQKSYLIHSDEYSGWVFDPTHPTQGRRFDNARNLVAESALKNGNSILEMDPRPATREELERVHSAAYVERVMKSHRSGEWQGARPDLSLLASLFAGGTLVALDLLLNQKTKLAIHFPGAKHHAQYDRSSGFCVFNDFALAADIATKDHGLRVVILDIDAHHGDGVENLLADNPMVLTFSIHQRGIFPGTGNESSPGSFYNFPLQAGAGDEELLKAVDEFIYLVRAGDRIWDWRPDLLFITCGADGHAEDPLTSLQYSVEGYVKVARKIGECFPEIPILFGGAGGYLPDTRTPQIWSEFVGELAKRKVSN